MPNTKVIVLVILGEARVWAASYLKKMIVKAREATIE
jgi:hypothetical protein